MLKSPVKAKEKVVLFLEISHVKIFLSPTYPLKSNVYENIYFLFQKTHTHTHKTFTSKSIRTNASFFPSKKKKDRAFCFSTKKVLVQQFFKCKIYFKNSNKLIIFFFFVFLWPPRWRFFSSPTFPETRVLFLWLNDAGLVSLMETISYVQGYN